MNKMVRHSMDCAFKQQKYVEDKAKSESNHCQLALGWQTEKLCQDFLLNSVVCTRWICGSFPKHLCVVFQSMSFSGGPCKNDGSKEASHQEESAGLRALENL